MCACACSARGAASNTLDIYDMAATTWTSNVVYQRQQETFTTGSAHELVGDYIYSVKDATGRMFRFDVAKQKLDPFATLTYPQGAATVGDKLFDASYTDGGTTIRWIYLIRNTGAEMFRCMVI